MVPGVESGLMVIVFIGKRKHPSVSFQELLEHEFLVQHLSNPLRELLEYLDILCVLERQVFIQRPFVCEELFDCLLQLLVDLNIVVEFLDGTEKFGQLIALI